MAGASAPTLAAYKLSALCETRRKSLRAAVGANEILCGAALEQRQAEEQAALAAEQDALCEDLAHLRWLVADLKFDLAWRRLCRKYGYNPEQPRVPAGNPDGGQWTRDGGGEN